MATMHVVATNIILWFRTLIKESIEEIWEYEESSTHHFKVHLTNLNFFVKQYTFFKFVTTTILFDFLGCNRRRI